MMASPTKERALALFDQGQIAPARRVAGGVNNLTAWLEEREAAPEPELPPRHAEQDAPSGRPKGRRNRTSLEVDYADNYLVYIEASGRNREPADIRVIRQIFETAKMFTKAEFMVRGMDIVYADSMEDNDAAQSARACWVACVCDIIPDLKARELAVTLRVDEERVAEIKLLHSAQMPAVPGYAIRYRRVVTKTKRIIGA